MDGRGRLAQPLTWAADPRARPQDLAATGSHAPIDSKTPPSPQRSNAHEFWGMMLKLNPPRGVGLLAALLVVLGGLVYGVIKGEHVSAVVDMLDQIRNDAANAAGFR